MKKIGKIAVLSALLCGLIFGGSALAEETEKSDTLVEAYDFTDITVIPFCTSGGSGIGRSGEDLEEKAGTGTWKKGMRFSGTVSEDELKEWVDGLSGIGVSERGAGGRTHM